MAVQARFYISKITKHASFDGFGVELLPAVRGEGNKDWAKYTPSGKIELNVSPGGAADWFESHLGKDVALTFDEITADQ